MNNLNSISVLVTRPSPAGDALCQLIKMHGGEAFHLPTIEIVPPENQSEFNQHLNDVCQHDWLVFISPQAVYAIQDALKKRYPALSPIKIAAIGEGTAQALQQAGLHVTLYPKTAWNSEGLLALPEMNQVKQKKIMIVRGQDGRELLAETLAQRGAIITHLIAYRRDLPKINVQPYFNLLQKNKINAIICASYTAVKNLKILMGEAGWLYIKDMPLIVISERIKTLAQELGFQTIWVTSNASENAIIEMIRGKNNVSRS
jgi:uroporphyrinogen-III synthase